MNSSDSIIERANRIEHTLHEVGDPTAQVALGGPCPTCGARVETVLRQHTATVSCGACGGEFTVAA